MKQILFSVTLFDDGSVYVTAKNDRHEAVAPSLRDLADAVECGALDLPIYQPWTEDEL